MYLINNSFIYQRHYDVDKSKSLHEYVLENLTENLNSNDVYYIIANKDHLYEINLIGGLIIEEIKNKKYIDEIVNKLLDIFKIDSEELKKDVISFINYLQQLNIIENEY